MKKQLLVLLLISSQVQAVLPPGSCKPDEVQVTAADLIGGQCVNKKNLDDTLSYLNDTLELDVTKRELVRACNELKQDNLDNAYKYLHIDDEEILEGNKERVTRAACKGLESGFLPKGPETCEVPGCPVGEPEPCPKDKWVMESQPNTNCQKYDLNGDCLEFGECAMY